MPSRSRQRKTRPIKIAPSILSADFSRLGDEVRAVERAGADLIHVDVMDGHFVPNLTVGPLMVAAVRKVTRLPLDVHLMMTNPESFIDEFIQAGSNYLTVHVETCPHLHRTIQAIKARGVKAGVTLNPATPLAAIEPILGEADLLLVMSVNPGFGGQSFIPAVLEKVRQARRAIDARRLRVLLEVDGGITIANARTIARAGADILVSGSAIFHSADYTRTIARLKKAGDGAR